MERWPGWWCMAGSSIGGSFRGHRTARPTAWPRTDGLAGRAGSSAPPSNDPAAWRQAAGAAQ
eukprot:10899767-Alexandrium_andersonii.AAC.1